MRLFRRDNQTSPDQPGSPRGEAHGPTSRSKLVSVDFHARRISRREGGASESELPSDPTGWLIDSDQADADQQRTLSPLNSSSGRSALISFVAVVLVPLIALLLYTAYFASRRYTTEFRFSVTELTPPNGGNPGAGAQGSTNLASTALSMMGGGAAVAGAAQNYIVVDYLRSPQVIGDILARHDLRGIYGRRSIDWWSRLSGEPSDDDMLSYWNQINSAEYDPIKGIAVVKITSFDPRETLVLAKTLMELSEELINAISRRSQQDAIKFAEYEVARARMKVERTRNDLERLRSEEGVIDPTTNVVASNAQLASALRATLSDLLREQASLSAQAIGTNSPAMLALASRIEATRKELERVEREVSQVRSGKAVLARVVSRFEALDVDRRHAEALLLNALQVLDRAKATAAAQHLYLTAHVRPMLPDRPSGPLVLKSMLVGALILFGIWLVGMMAAGSLRSAFVRR